MEDRHLNFFRRSLQDTLAGIDGCVSAKLHMPCKILVYSLIDTVAWTAFHRTTMKTRARFECWSNRWLIPQLSAGKVDVTATDLYAARCAVLHAMSPDSPLSRTGQARPIAYAWGPASATDLLKMMKDAGKPNVAAVHYETLVDCVRAALDVFFIDVSADPVLALAVQKAAQQQFAYIDLASISQTGSGETQS